MFIKICANTNLEDALLAAELGADAVGFVFAPSKRQVTVEQVAAITAELPAGVEKVGVFTTVDAGEILDAAERAGLTMMQLHSAFDPGLVAKIGDTVRVLQVVDVAEGSEAKELEALLRAALGHPQVEAVLLDASHGGASGGTGKTFDWGRTAEVVRTVQRETGGKVIVAGGLRAENVAGAIAAFAPFGVDVASGVEAVPGKKDPAKLRAFLGAARGRD
jgi:phosphoribosylanthranilate isomerase